MTQLFTIFISCFCLSVSISFAQYSSRLTTANGLPHNAVTAVEQDEAGFIWIATHDGLARYDGWTMKIFRNRPGDSTSLAHNKIIQFERTMINKFLVITESGSVQFFDPVTERFSTLLDEKLFITNNIRVSQAHLSPDGRHLWAMQPNTSLIDYDLALKTVKIYPVANLTTDAFLRDFVLSPQGFIYGQCSDGLLELDSKTGRHRVIPLPFEPITYWEEPGFWPINGRKVTEGPLGQIAIFGREVIGLYDPASGKVQMIPIPGAIRTGFKQNRKLATVVSYSMKTMSDNQLYLGYTNKVYRLEKEGFTELHPQGAPLEKVAPWLVDRSGVLWMSGASAGLKQLNLHALPFAFSAKHKSFSVDLIEQDLRAPLPSHYEVWDNDRWPRYMLATNGTGYLIDPFRVYRHQPTANKVSEIASLWQHQGEYCCKLAMKVTPLGRVWIYSNQVGLVEGDVAGRMSQVHPNSLLPLLERKRGGLDVADIQPMGNVVWIGSQVGQGLFRYDTVKRNFDKPLVNNPGSKHSLNSDIINCLTTDPVDSTVLWIGTAGGGLCRLDTRKMIVRRFSLDEGFPSSIVQSVETDRNGFLWCATNFGLVCFDPRSMHWRHFSTDDGLAENTFLQTSSARLPDGRLVFGIASGRIIFDPASIQDIKFQPPLVLTSLSINNKPTDIHKLGLAAGQFVLPSPINTLTELVLDHTQNFLTLTFAGLDFANGQKQRYRYKLEGVDTDWVTIGAKNTATYTQLVAGRYIFKINNTLANGHWSQHVKKLQIIITPPFWATIWAYIGYALTMGGLVLAFIHFRLKQARQQQEIELKQREAEQLKTVDEVKSRFFSNITHEFRTPLTLILSPTEKLLAQPAQGPETQQALTTIHVNAVRLLRLVNQLLDLAKMEGGSMSTLLVCGDAAAYIRHVTETFYPFAASRAITLSFETDWSEDPFKDLWLFDADKWEKILNNLLSNSLKFTPIGGQVTLTVKSVTEDELKFQLVDNGVGIPKEHIHHVFDRFYQADTSQTRAYEGSGIGLALVKELVDLLGGKIEVHSVTWPTSGTTFTVVLPLVRAMGRHGFPDLVISPLDGSGVRFAPDTLSKVDPVPAADLPADAPLILIVEDNQDLQNFLASELGGGYRVLTANDGQQGWELCQQHLPEVVIADVMMPLMDGYQLTQLIKSTMATNHIAVVLLTARAAQESRIAGLEKGADDYITKPFHINEILLRLDNMLMRQANLRAHLYRLLSQTSPNEQEPLEDPFILRLQQSIEAHLDDNNFGIDELAAAVSMSRRTLNRKLHVTANVAASEFIRTYRLQRARHLLQAGHSVSESAYMVGFESPAYFSTVFKAIYGQTPSEFVMRWQS